jgi:hypothetical protein
VLNKKFWQDKRGRIWSLNFRSQLNQLLKFGLYCGRIIVNVQDLVFFGSFLSADSELRPEVFRTFGTCRKALNGETCFMTSRVKYWVIGLMVILGSFLGSALAQAPPGRRVPILPPIYVPQAPGILPASGQLETPDSEIEILYLYWLGSPGGERVEKEVLADLESSLPAGVRLIQVPVISDLTSPVWQSHGRLALTLERLGAAEKLRPAAAAAIRPAAAGDQYDRQGRGVPLFSLEEQAQFLAENGYSREDFFQAYYSAEVQEKFETLKQYLTVRQVQAAPFFIIKGHYYYYSPNFSKMSSFKDDFLKFIQTITAGSAAVPVPPVPDALEAAPVPPVQPPSSQPPEVPAAPAAPEAAPAPPVQSLPGRPSLPQTVPPVPAGPENTPAQPPSSQPPEAPAAPAPPQNGQPPSPVRPVPPLAPDIFPPVPDPKPDPDLGKPAPDVLLTNPPETAQPFSDCQQCSPSRAPSSKHQGDIMVFSPHQDFIQPPERRYFSDEKMPGEAAPFESRPEPGRDFEKWLLMI